MGRISKAFRIVRNVKDKIRTGETWYDDQIAQPMLSEVEAAKGGDFPGEYGSRESNWSEAVSTPAQRKAHKDIREVAEDYTGALNEVGELEEKRVSTAQHFIGNLPGGEIDGTEVRIVTEVTQREGRRGPAEPRPEKNSFDLWLENAWSAFEQSNGPEELRRNLEATARSTDILDPDVFQCWEEQLGCDDWANRFWSEYEDEYLFRYLRTVRRLSKRREDTKTFANELDALIENKID